MLANLFDFASGFRQRFESTGCRSLFNKMTRFDMETLLPALLQVEDRTSMAVSLESRVPLLDHRIAELVASMPPRIKYEGGRSKHIFRRAIRAEFHEQKSVSRGQQLQIWRSLLAEAIDNASFKALETNRDEFENFRDMVCSVKRVFVAQSEQHAVLRAMD